MYLSFLGTDKTILGWKEDFNMSFMKNVPSQIEGLKYLKKISKKYPDKKIILGGHSKGGNIAIYSGLEANEQIQKRIINIYNFDGPGFDSDFIKTNKTDKTIKKVLTYIPQDSIIGRIMEHEEECNVVKSIESGIYQHDIYSWQILRDKMVKVESLTTGSDIMNDSIKQWIKTTTPEQRKVFFDGIFELFYSTEAKTFGDINIKSIPTLIKTYRDISEEDRKVIIHMLKIFGKAYITSLKNRDNNSLE